MKNIGAVLLPLFTLAFHPGSTDSPKVRELASPAGPGSAQPHLASARDAAFLSWLEAAPEGGHALRFSRWEGSQWAPAKTIVRSGSFFVNWADFPSFLALADGTLVAHWLEKGGSGPYEYNVRVSHSRDRGETWSEAVSPHRDGTLNEHGFVSLIERGPLRFSAVWLDGRNFKKPPPDDPAKDMSNEMSLMFSTWEGEGFRPEIALDTRVCDCCQTAAAATEDGLFVAYRDRSADEVRDIAYVRYAEGRWSEPRTLHPDGWEIPACPVNGPAVAAEGNRLVVAWYSFARQQGRVNVIFSRDGGRSFETPARVDDGRPLGRADVEWMPDGSALVIWLEDTGQKAGEIRARRVRPDGSADPSFLVASTTSGRSSGFPRMARAGDDVLFAWTDAGDPSRVRVARAGAGTRAAAP
jgi:hypothetical protein